MQNRLFHVHSAEALLYCEHLMISHIQIRPLNTGHTLRLWTMERIGSIRRSSGRFCKHGKIPILERTLHTIYNAKNREHLSFEVFPVYFNSAVEPPPGFHHSTATPWNGPCAILWRSWEWDPRHRLRLRQPESPTPPPGLPVPEGYG